MQIVILGDEARRIDAILKREPQTAQRAAQKFLDQLALVLERRVRNREAALGKFQKVTDVRQHAQPHLFGVDVERRRQSRGVERTGFKPLESGRGRAGDDALHVFVGIQLATRCIDLHRQVGVAAERADADGFAFEIGGGFYIRPRDDIKRRLFKKPDDRAHGHVLTGDKTRRRTDATGRL